jgi:hypothetical protein
MSYQQDPNLCRYVAYFGLFLTIWRKLKNSILLAIEEAKTAKKPGSPRAEKAK